MFTNDKLKEKRRLLSHLLFKSGNLIMGIDHFLVVFPSILLMAKILNDNNFDNNSISSLLLFTGICNLFFYRKTKSKIPIFLAPSFTFIGFTTTTMLANGNDIAAARFTVFLGYFFAGLLFLFISWIYKSASIRKYVKLILPDALVGPLISLIGLDLLDTAINDSGFNTKDVKSIIIAMFTLCMIIFATVKKRRHFRNASILIGVVLGVVLACFLGEFRISNVNSEIISFPGIKFYLIDLFNQKAWERIDVLKIIIAIIPATMVDFSENITKMTLIEKIMRADHDTKENDFSKFYQSSVSGHARSLLLSVVFGSVPNAIYAENIALMEINNIEGYNRNKIHDEGNNITEFYKRISTYPLKIAAAIFIICSMFTIFQNILADIPMPVYGGMELFVFSLIAAQGVQLLVDRKVEYKKVTNQIITSVTLLTGLSGITINLGVTEISGLSLAFIVGITLNLFLKICSHYGWINEKMSVIDVIGICVSVLEKHHDWTVNADNANSEEVNQYLRDENRTDQIISPVRNITGASIVIDDSQTMKIWEANDGLIWIDISQYKNEYIKIINDYPENVMKKGNNCFSVCVNENMSIHKLKNICRSVWQ